MKITHTMPVVCGDARLDLEFAGDLLHSLGAVTIGGVPMRNPTTRFLPWFDTYEGEVFRQFRFGEITTRESVTRIHTWVSSDPDALFRERRDCSGDVCFRNANWDAAPLEVDLTICLAPAQAQVKGREFAGLKYWFEYHSDTLPIHRLVDRQTWEIGGNLDDVTICLRNWLTPPRMKIGRETVYSTVGLDNWAKALPGNLWARWSLLPSFDMQYGRRGVLLAWFDQVSLIRTVIESNAGEDCLRCLDMHLFAQSSTVKTNPKTVLWSPDVLDDVDALNLWLEVSIRENERARAQFGIKTESPPAIEFKELTWEKDMHFDRTWERAVDVASEFGADCVLIDSVWEHMGALKSALDNLLPPERQKGTILEKFQISGNMCITLDYEVPDVQGGEIGLKALCDRARAKGVKIICWAAVHFSPHTILQNDRSLQHGSFGIFAAKESGRHPDTGYAAECWTANLNGPVYERIKAQILGVCARTGLAGFAWDSFSNMGWWQVDYSDGTMRPQFDKVGELYAAFANAGLHVIPEGLVTFSNHSCCGLHGGNIYAGDLLGYSSNTTIALWFGEDGVLGKAPFERQILNGTVAFDTFFQCIAFKRIPELHFHTFPREEWDPERVKQIKTILGIYKRFRHLMGRPTVMKKYVGVFWENETDTRLYFSFVSHSAPCPGVFTDALTNTQVSDGRLQPLHAYLVTVPSQPDADP